MSSLYAATYIVGYLTPIAGIIYIALEMFVKNQKLNNRIAYWFFMFAILLTSYASLVDMVLKSAR
jgi:hypothetical protein